MNVLRKCGQKEKMKTKIFFDFDNTLVDTTSAFVSWYNNKNDTQIDPKEIINYNFEPQLKLSKEEMIKGFSSDEFFSFLRPFDGVREFLEQLKQTKLFEMYLVSNCSNESIIQKIKWLYEFNLEKYFDGKIFLSINKPIDKSLIDMSKSIFIDDHKENHLSSNAKYKFAFKDLPQRTWHPTQDDGVMVFSKWNSGLVEYFKYIARHNK